MKVLVTGATGTIGSSIVENLAAEGYEVLCPVRNLSKAAELLSHLGDLVKIFPYDMSVDLDDRFYIAAKGIPNIIHSGFITSEIEKDLETQVLKGLLKAAKETALGTTVNFVYSTGCHIQGETFELKGEDEATSDDSIEFMRFRVDHERLVMNENSENLKVSIVRPCWVYGGSHVDYWFRACKKNNKIIVPAENKRLCYIERTDLAELFKLIIKNSQSGYFTASEGAGPTTEELVEVAKRITKVTEVERINNVWEFIPDYGILLFGLTISTMLDGKRARELMGYIPKHLLIRDAELLIQLA